MLRRIGLASAIGALIISMAWAAEFAVPRLTGPVVDQAELISPSTEAQITQILQDLRKETGTQINILTVTTLGGLAIEQASIQVTDQWKLGSKEKDLGVLLLVAPNDRAVRIEVGQGLEGVLTDAHSKRIIDQAILPFFREGNFEDGIRAGTYQIIRNTNPKFLSDRGTSDGVSERRSRSKGTPRLAWVIVVFLFLLIRFLGSLNVGGGRPFGGRGGLRGGRGWGSGGFGGGGFGGGGGGWSGGGGGFSGGGASGRW